MIKKIKEQCTRINFFSVPPLLPPKTFTQKRTLNYNGSAAAKNQNLRANPNSYTC
ncbi:hypothetical protein EMIT0194MI4_80251 [Pseudomonas sp. IT-194MI4]